MVKNDVYHVFPRMDGGGLPPLPNVDVRRLNTPSSLHQSKNAFFLVTRGLALSVFNFTQITDSREATSERTSGKKCSKLWRHKIAAVKDKSCCVQEEVAVKTSAHLNVSSSSSSPSIIMMKVDDRLHKRKKKGQAKPPFNL